MVVALPFYIGKKHQKLKNQNISWKNYRNTSHVDVYTDENTHTKKCH